MVNNVDYHWCAKCGNGRWSPSHGTAEHTNPTPSNRKPEANSAEIEGVEASHLHCDWDTGDDWYENCGECNVVDIPYGKGYRTFIGDNLPEEVFGIFVWEDEENSDWGGDIVIEHYDTSTSRCDQCNDNGPTNHWCVVCQDGSLYDNPFADDTVPLTKDNVGFCTNCGEEGLLGFRCDRETCLLEAYSIFWTPGKPYVMSNTDKRNEANRPKDFFPKVVQQEPNMNPQLCPMDLPFVHHFLYTVELTVVCFYTFLSMQLETKQIVNATNNTILTYEYHYVFMCMTLAKVTISWLYLLMRVLEVVVFYVLMDIGLSSC